MISVRAVVIRVAISMGFVGAAWAAADFLADPAPNEQIAVQALAVPTTTVGSATLPSTTTTGPPPTSPPTTAPATTATPTTTITSNDHDQRGAAALGKIRYPWQSKLPGWTIEFNPSRSGVLGYTFTNEKRIEIYVRDSMSEGLLAHVVAHEIGHAVDVSRNSGSERRSWLEARGLPDAPWWPDEGGLSDFKSGAGDFAEGFAAWQVGTGSYRSKLGPAPNSEQLELIAQISN